MRCMQDKLGALCRRAKRKRRTCFKAATEHYGVGVAKKLRHEKTMPAVNVGFSVMANLLWSA